MLNTVQLRPADGLQFVSHADQQLLLRAKTADSRLKAGAQTPADWQTTDT